MKMRATILLAAAVTLSGAIAWGLAWGDAVFSPELRVLHVVQFEDPIDAAQGGG